MLLINTAKAFNANSYFSVAEADAYLRTARLYTTAWDALSGSDAEGWTVTGNVAAGEVSVAVENGTGSLAVGDVFKFEGHATEYKVATAFSATPITFTPALTDAVVLGEALVRLTASKKEKALIWATALLDVGMNWSGFKRTEAQSLRWPRSGVATLDGYWYDYDTIPEMLKAYTVEMALALLSKDRSKEPALLGLGLESGSIGPLSMTISQKMVEALIPDFVREGLRSLGMLAAELNRGGGMVSLFRV